MEMLERSNTAYALHCEASALRTQGRNGEAADKWLECVRLIPDEPAYLREYADCLARLSRWDEVIRYASLASALEPSNAEAWALTAGAYGNLGRQEEFKRYLDRADTLAPHSPSVIWNRSLWYLLHGRYEEGWRDYEWRFMSNQRRRTLKEPWRGDPIPGRTLFVWAEQGFGDTLQFVRFLRLAKERSRAHVVFEAQRELLTLLHSQEIGADEIVAPNAGGSIPLEDFEHVSLMSLPYVLGISEESQFWTGGYLHSEAVDLTASSTSKRKIGVCWRGSPNHSADDARSIPEREFFDAIIAPNATSPQPSASEREFSITASTFYSINPGAVLPDCANCVNPDLPSFRETARVMKSLDLVVTVDTAVAHLAGALGVPTFLLLRYATDWRWCLNHAETSPWYPSMRLFRQASYDAGWREVLERVAARLADR